MAEEANPDSERPDPKKSPKARRAVLGLSPDEIGALRVEDLVNNELVLKMLLFRYGEYIDENKSLQSEIESLQAELQIYVAYREGYGQRRTNSRTAASLNLIGTVLVGIGTNLSTPTLTVGGAVTFGAGVIVAFMGLYFSWRD